jgi:hypothetical protein
MNFSFLSFSFTNKANRHGSPSKTKEKKSETHLHGQTKKERKKNSNTNFQYCNYTKKTLWKHIIAIAPKEKPKKTNKWISCIFLLLYHKIESNKKVNITFTNNTIKGEKKHNTWYPYNHTILASHISPYHQNKHNANDNNITFKQWLQVLINDNNIFRCPKCITTL